MEVCSEEAVKYVWEGAIPLQVHLHESEVTTLPPPPPALVLGSRIGYFPLLVPLIKPYFSSALPPGEDTVWFDYNGLPLKWYVPVGVLFDLLCAEPERPWNITVHFRGYPGEVLTPCEGEDSVKWSYINSLKEASYVITGNCKNVMNMSQADQFDLWQSLVKGNMDGYLRISSRLKLGPLGEDCILKRSSSLQPRQATDEPEIVGFNRPTQIRTPVIMVYTRDPSVASICDAYELFFKGRIPVRLYLRNVDDNLEDLEDAPTIDSWERISYINRAVEIHKEGGNYMTLKHAMRTLLPEIFDEVPMLIHEAGAEGNHEADSCFADSETVSVTRNDLVEETSCTNQQSNKAKLIRIQGIEPDLDIPFSWVVNNLKYPDYFLHICVFVRATSPQAKST
ncbi:autophagy-related protein [Canna indica]|uniref:Autophagy protein 5 n=1 Tax=Canna indica TaxID=4628 RepID=A0AAQ3KWA5_9LILI|nr:autophagy-related protein [Canna indica]